MRHFSHTFSTVNGSLLVMGDHRILNRKDLVGGPGGVRTLDLMTASHARSQLRHRPTSYVMTGGSILPYCTFVGKVGIRLSKLPPVKVL